jgi:hypothetical protein
MASAVAANNIEDRISGFLGLLPGFGNTPAEFLTDISAKTIPGSAGQIDYNPYIKPIPDEIETSLARIGNISDTYRDRVYKVTTTATPTIIKLFNKDSSSTRQFIKEALIQYILSTDSNIEISKRIPKLHGIYQTRSKLIIHMDEGLMTLDKYFKRSINATHITEGQSILKFSVFKDCMIQILDLLQLLIAKYSFAHRDLKFNNIMFLGDVSTVGLIDFGFSGLTLNFAGTRYRIINDKHYKYELECNPKQDMGILLAYLSQFYNENFDEKTRIFISRVFPAGNVRSDTLYGRISRRQQTRRGPSLFHGSYNFQGNIYNCPLSDPITIENVRRSLEVNDDDVTLFRRRRAEEQERARQRMRNEAERRRIETERRRIAAEERLRIYEQQQEEQRRLAAEAAAERQRLADIATEAERVERERQAAIAAEQREIKRRREAEIHAAAAEADRVKAAAAAAAAPKPKPKPKTKKAPVARMGRNNNNNYYNNNYNNNYQGGGRGRTRRSKKN